MCVQYNATLIVIGDIGDTVNGIVNIWMLSPSRVGRRAWRDMSP